MRPAWPALACLAAGALIGCSEPPAGRTVLLISLDSVRADTLDFEDATSFPALAGIAKGGTVFDQAISGSSWTLPAHATLFTGSPPPFHGVEFDDTAIDPAQTTLPELLHDAGWYTAGWWTGWYTAGEYGFGRGFDSYSNAMTGGRQLEAQFQRALASGDFDAARAVLNGRDVAGHRDITSPNVVAGLEAVVDFVDADRDLFLFAHLFDPHYDYIPPAPFDTRFDPDYTGDLDGRDFYENTRIYDATKTPPRQIGARDLEHIRALYRGELAFTDAAIGQMLAALDDAGRLDDALIVVTADHGEEFFEHGNRGHRAGLYDEVLRVPLLVRDPSAPAAQAARHVPAQVGLVDVLPTIAGFAGLPAPATSQGIDLGPAVRGAALASRPMISSLMQHSAGLGYLFLESYRLPDSKLIRTLRLPPGGSLELVRAQLFDLEADPGEHSNQTNLQAAPLSAEWANMQAGFSDLRQLFGASPHAPRSERGTRVRELFEADLGGLGYADGDDQASASPGLSLPWPPGPRPALTDPSD